MTSSTSAIVASQGSNDIANGRSGFPFAKLAGRALIVLFLLSLFQLPFLFEKDKYYLPLFSRYAAVALFALSVDLIWGYTGLLSLGQGLYFGLGVYAVGYSLKLQKTALEAGVVPGGSEPLPLPDFMAYCRLTEVPFWIAPLVNIWLAIALAVALPLLVAFVFGFIIFRLRITGVYFSLITQALVLALFMLVANQQPYTGGVVGLTYLGKLELFGQTFVMEKMYYLIVGVLIFSYFVCVLLMRSKLGRVLTAIRDNENRTLALGYDTAMYKTFIFAFAGALAGLAGALYVAALGTAGPDTLDISFSIVVVILVAVGGRGTLIGAILGAMLIQFTQTYVNDIKGIPIDLTLGQFELRYNVDWPIILGSIFVLVVVFMPDGIIGALRKIPSVIPRVLFLLKRSSSAVPPPVPVHSSETPIAHDQRPISASQQLSVRPLPASGPQGTGVN